MYKLYQEGRLPAWGHDGKLLDAGRPRDMERWFRRPARTIPAGDIWRWRASLIAAANYLREVTSG